MQAKQPQAQKDKPDGSGRVENDQVKDAKPPEAKAGTLKETGNRLGVEIVGTNDKARPKNHMFGLDFILLKPE